MNKIKNKNNSYASSSLLGARYVFFNSLYETQPQLASNVESHFNKINSQFFNNNYQEQNSKNQESLNYMKEYLNFLQTLITNEKKAEIQYLNKLIESTTRKDLLSTEIISDIKKCLESPDSFDYIKMQTILNKIRQDEQDFLESLNTQINNIELYEKNLETFLETSSLTKQNIVENLQEVAVTDFDLYKKILAKYFKTSLKNNENQIIKKWESSTLTSIKQLIENNLTTIQNSDKLKDILYNMLIKGSLSNIDDLKKLIINLSFNKINLSELLKNNADSSTITNELQQYISSAEIENIIHVNDKNVFDKYETLEQQALEFGKGLADRALRDPAYLETHFKDLIGERATQLIVQIKEAGDQANYTRLKSLKGVLTKMIQKAVKEQRDLVISAGDKVIQQASEKEKNAYYLMGIQPNTKIRPTDLISSLILNVSIPSLAEIKNAPEIKKGINNLIQDMKTKSYAGGTLIQLKNDIMITWYWDEQKLKEIFTDNKKISQNETDTFIDTIINGYKNFLQDYNKKSKGKTDPDQAFRSYLAQLINTAKQYKTLYGKLYQDEKARQQLIDYMNNLFFESVTVKEYDSYSPDVGYKAGSLGGSGKVIDAVPNILKMYELGGISTIDAENIIEALLNCGPDQMAPANLVDNFKNYLIGGAAMLLFDEGFANAENFLEYMKKLFFNTTGPKQVHLLLLNNTYYFFSFILQQIYTNLTNIYQELVSKVKDPNEIITKNYLYVYNNIQLSHIGDETMDSASRWNLVSQKAQQEVTINFMFMGGILDILQKMAEAF